MITGHFGVAAAIRSGWRDASLLWLLPASVAPDVVDVTLALCGICNPNGLYSHTVPAAALLAALLGGIAWLCTRSRATALATVLVVLVHLPPDLLTGFKSYWPGSPPIGLRLYRHPLLDFLVEAPVVLGGWWLLRRERAAPRWATAAAGALALVAAQAVLDAANLGLKPNACAPLAVPASAGGRPGDLPPALV